MAFMMTVRAWVLVILLGAAGVLSVPAGAPAAAQGASSTTVARLENTRVLFEDDFRSAKRWNEGISDACKTSYAESGFVVEDVPPPGTCEFDLLQAGAFPDHVRIEVSVLLRQGDLGSSFGLKFGRVSPDNHLFHTFTVSADGAYDLALKDGQWRELIARTQDRVVNTGYDATNRLAVEIRGHRIRCFINDKFVGEIASPADARGTIGLYLDTVGMEAIFSDLRVVDLFGSAASAPANPPKPAPATPAPQPATSPAQPAVVARVIFEDDFIANQSWAVGIIGPCKSSYSPEGFVVEDVAPSGTCEYTLQRVGTLPDNVRIEISVAVRKGNTRSAVGLKFGQSQQNPSFYTFTVNGEGSFRVSQWNGEWRYPINWTADAVVKRGYGAANRLAVEIKGRTIVCYINDKPVGTVQGSSEVRGETGIFLARPGLEAAFNHLRIVEPATK